MYAGVNEFYKYGKEAQKKVTDRLIPVNGYYTIEADGGKYWAFGTSVGKFGEYAKYGDTFFSVNSRGLLWAKEGTEKGEKFVKMLNNLLKDMKKANEERLAYVESLHDEEI